MLANEVENLTGLVGTGQALTGNALDNVITAGGGNDVIDGGSGADQMAGGMGNDAYYVDNLADAVIEAANAGTDEVRTSLANYSLGGNLENLTGLLDTGQALTGNALDNVITAGGGNDVIDGGLGADTMAGGMGNDTYYVDNAADTVTEAASAGTDEVRTSLASYTLGANLENLTGTLGAAQALTGNALANTITGGAGNDLIDGGTGADRLVGGGGNDIYYVDNVGDVVVEAAGGGSDEVRTSLSTYVLPDNVERLVYVGAGDFNATGGGNADRISAGAGNDTIDAMGGDDYIDASQGGNDTINGGSGNDAILMGAAFNSSDHIDGGLGANDQLGLQGQLHRRQCAHAERRELDRGGDGVAAGRVRL